MVNWGFEHKLPNFQRRKDLILVDVATLPRSCFNEHVGRVLQELQREPRGQSMPVSSHQRDLKESET